MMRGERKSNYWNSVDVAIAKCKYLKKVPLAETMNHCKIKELIFSIKK